MLITTAMPHEPGSPYPPALPPPLLPKPAKDNLRLQKLLKKAAKKKVGLSTLQTSSFRASLSPVSEASHDQDFGPQPCPETPRATVPPAVLAPPAPLAPSALQAPLVSIVPPSPLALPAPPAPPAPPALPSPLALPAPPAPPAPPSPLVLPAPRILVPASRSPYTPIIQHVPSPLQKKSFSFSLKEQWSLAEHFRITTPQFGSLCPNTPKPTGRLDPIPSPKKVTHVSQVHIHVGPVLSPQFPAPAVNLAPGSWGNGEQDSPRIEAQERPGDHEPLGAPHQPSAMPQIPVAHIQPLTPNAQATSRSPEPPATTGCSPSVAADGPKQVLTEIVVPIAPTSRSPGPSQNSAVSRTPSAKMEPPPVPKPSTGYPKFTAPSNTKQQLPGPANPSRAFSPEPPRGPQASSMLDPAPGGEVPKAAPTPIPSTRFSGWSRLKKQLLVAPEVPTFPEPKGAKAQTEQVSKGLQEAVTSPSAPRPPVSRATKMWDAVLYRMSVAKGGDRPKQRASAPPGGLVGHSSFLPFLCRPRFDARKLQEMTTQPPAKGNTVLGMSLRPSLGPKNFNRTAACWQLK